jgi:hypothetical protein
MKSLTVSLTSLISIATAGFLDPVFVSGQTLPSAAEAVSATSAQADNTEKIVRD